MGTLTSAAGVLNGSNGGILLASDYGLVSSLSLDQTTLFQAFINDTSAKLKLIDVQIVKYTTAMTLPAGGTHIMGYGSGGDFATYLVPTDCAAFNLTGVHHSMLENFMIWPQGTSAPTTIMTITNTCYSLRFNNIRIHVASTYVPSVAVINLVKGNGTNLDIVFDHVMIRQDGGTYYPIGYQFGADFGQAMLIGCDTEGCTVGFYQLGGKVQVLGGHAENMGTNAVSLEPSTDANASFSMLSASLNMAGTSGHPVAIRAGAKNVRFTGTVIDPASDLHVVVFDLTGSSNVVVDYANPDPTKWSALYNPMVASTIRLGAGQEQIPASKFSSINVTTGTLSAGDITGAHFVSLMTTNATPGNQATRTAAQMITDHGMGPVDASYTLRITNTGAGTFTLTAGSNVTLTGTMTVAQNTWRDFNVTFRGTPTQTVTIQSIGIGTYS